MNILITGSTGFIGKNLISELKNKGYNNILKVEKNTTKRELELYCEKADFVFHFAGINRPKNEQEFTKGNVDFTKELLSMLKKHSNQSPILMTSSIQATKDNPYGLSKKKAETLLFKHSSKNYIYRLPNVFGKWGKPNYNSVITTFCYNITRNKKIIINDPNVVLSLVYIDDVIEEFINALEGTPNKKGKYCKVKTEYTITLKEIVDSLYDFKHSRKTCILPNLGDDFTKKLYSTYLSYLPKGNFAYKLKTNRDDRGSFTEFIKTTNHGQISINISKPNITKGNHWHHTKIEKFLVIQGKGLVQLRKLNTKKIIEYFVNAQEMKVIEIPPGYTHNLINLGLEDMITIIWANELFNQEKPDTYFLEV